MIYRTVFTVEVFSEGPYIVRDLERVLYDISEGPCIGDYELASSDVVAPEDVEAHLLRIGNDGTFFDPVDG